MDFWHFDSLKEDDVNSIIDMARQSAEPGYRNYMSTVLNRSIVSFLHSSPDSSELMAELAVYDALVYRSRFMRILMGVQRQNVH